MEKKSALSAPIRGKKSWLNCEAWSASAFFRRQFPELRGESCVDCRIDRLMFRAAARREGTEVIAVSPIARGSNRSGGKASATIWAHIVQHLIDAGCAKCAFKRTDARFGRIRRKWSGAVLANGTQRQRFNDVELLVRQAVLAPNLFFGGGHKGLVFYHYLLRAVADSISAPFSARSWRNTER